VKSYKHHEQPLSRDNHVESEIIKEVLEEPVEIQGVPKLNLEISVPRLI